MANDTLRQIASNLWSVDASTLLNQYNNSYLSMIAYWYGVNLVTSKDLMKDILTEVGGNPSTSTDYLKDIVLTLGGTVPINGNWMEAWEDITASITPPQSISAPIISGNTTLGSVLTTTNGGWNYSPTSYAYQWKRGVTNIGGNSPNYTLVLADSDAAITCVVTATNAGGSTIGPSSNTITAANYTPVNSSPPVISGTTSVGSILTTTDGTWINSPSSFSYQWKRAATNIGTNANTYTLVQADAAQNITCVVTATNSIGSANATSNILYIYDLDAQNFITDAGITDSTEKGAINDLVIELKSDNLWTSMLAVYPFVGNTSTQQRFNLKDPLTFKITFNGGWTHSSNGALPNGTTAYANTNFIPATSWGTLGNSSISAYSRTNNSNAGLLWGTRTNNGNTRLEALLRSSGSTFIVHNSNSTQAPSPLPTTSAINFMSSRINTTNLIIAVNGTASSYVKTESITSTLPIYLSAQNNNGVTALFSDRQLAFAHIGTGLTTGQCTQLYTRIQTFQTRLSRQV